MSVLFILNRFCRRAVPLSAILLSLAACMDPLPAFRGPYLSWKEDPETTMTITYEHLEDNHTEVLWGESRQAMDNTIRLKPGKRRDDMYYHFTTTLTGLLPDTEYYYTVPGVMDGPARFRTAPSDRAASFSFLVYGDSAEYDKDRNNTHYALVSQMNRVDSAAPIGFVISSGDLAMTFADVYGWDLHFDAVRPLANHLPYFTPFGNHDWNRLEPNNTRLDGVWIHEFPEAEAEAEAQKVSGFGESSFAFGYGAAYFIFIGYNNIGADKQSDFTHWLKAQLVYAKENFAFTFVDQHRPPFDRRDDGYMDDIAVLENHAPLFHKHEVTIVFSGHNHLFAHHEIEKTPKGETAPVTVTYIISGGGGQELRKALKGDWDNRHGLGYVGKTVFAASTHHFVKVDVDGEENTVRLSAFDLNGERLYGPFEKNGREERHDD